MRGRAWVRGALLAGLVAGACEPAEAPAPPPGALRAAPETTMIPVRPPPRLVAQDSLPSRIFYDLTRFEWYAHGEPLVWQEREWQPRGAPVALRTVELRHVGEYGGVDVWVPLDVDSVTRIYVPVSEGYWLPFTAEGGERP